MCTVLIPFNILEPNFYCYQILKLQGGGDGGQAGKTAALKPAQQFGHAMLIFLCL